MSLQLRYSLLVLLSAVIAAAVWVITEVAINYLSTPPVTATMWGGLLGGLLLVGEAARRGELDLRGRSGRAWGRIVLGGLLIHGAGFLLGFIAAGLIGAGKSNLLGQVQTFFVVILAVLFLGERLSRQQTAGVFFALLGVTLLTFDPAAMWITWGTGETLTVIGRIMVAVGIVVMKPLFDHGRAAGTTGLAMLVGAGFLFLIYPFSGAITAAESAAAPGLAAIALIVLIGSGRGLSWLCFNIAQQVIGAARAVIIFLSYAFFTVLFQLVVARIAPWLGIQVPANLGMALVGGFLVAVGIVVLQGRPR